jgi:Dna[CI] antecedent, DciA
LPKISKFNMPNKLRRDKRGGSRNSATGVSKPFRSPHSVKAVLGRSTPTLTRVSDQAGRQGFWKQWLARHLPDELTPHLSGVVEREQTLVIFAESAAWSTRLRYVMHELEAQIKQTQPTIQRVSVRVMPKA